MTQLPSIVGREIFYIVTYHHPKVGDSYQTFGPAFEHVEDAEKYQEKHDAEAEFTAIFSMFIQ